MLRGIYTASAGMAAEMRRQQTAANNLANLGTPGYRQDLTAIESFPNLLIGRTGPQPAMLGALGTGVLTSGTPVDLSQGSFRDTERTLDLAIAGSGFFVVRTAEGDRYTRAGNFQLRPDGVLATQKGEPVLGDGGQITLAGENVTIGPDGTIYAAGERVARILVVAPQQPEAMQKTGDNLLDGTAAGMGPVQDGATRVVQGRLEDSNVDGTATMVEAMAALRAYEAAQRALKMQDATLKRAIEEVGRA